jgi:hypothetical protein
MQFRPHHFLCTLCYTGKGYSPAFVRNYNKIAQHLNAEGGEKTPIEVVPHTDSICHPCPHKRDLACESQAVIADLDAKHADALGLQAGDILTWEQAKQRIAERMTLEKFEHTCATCSWKKFGICEEILTKFLDAK